MFDWTVLSKIAKDDHVPTVEQQPVEGGSHQPVDLAKGLKFHYRKGFVVLLSKVFR